MGNFLIFTGGTKDSEYVILKWELLAICKEKIFTDHLEETNFLLKIHFKCSGATGYKVGHLIRNSLHILYAVHEENDKLQSHRTTAISKYHWRSTQAQSSFILSDVLQVILDLNFQNINRAQELVIKSSIN